MPRPRHAVPHLGGCLRARRRERASPPRGVRAVAGGDQVVACAAGPATESASGKRTATSSNAPSTSSRTGEDSPPRYDKHALMYRGGMVLASIVLWLS